MTAAPARALLPRRDEAFEQSMRAATGDDAAMPEAPAEAPKRVVNEEGVTQTTAKPRERVAASAKAEDADGKRNVAKAHIADGLAVTHPDAGGVGATAHGKNAAAAKKDGTAADAAANASHATADAEIATAPVTGVALHAAAQATEKGAAGAVTAGVKGTTVESAQAAGTVREQGVAEVATDVSGEAASRAAGLDANKVSSESQKVDAEAKDAAASVAGVVQALPLTQSSVSGSFAASTPAHEVVSSMRAAQTPVTTGTHAAAAGVSREAYRENWQVQSYEAPQPGKLEIGIQGGSLGWLSVRAELTHGGDIHAFLRGTGPLAQDVLQSHAGALSGYLETQQVKVSEIRVEPSRASGGEGALSQGAAGDRAGTRGDSSQQGREESGSMNFGGRGASLMNGVSSAMAMPGTLLGGSGGQYLSVFV